MLQAADDSLGIRMMKVARMLRRRFDRRAQRLELTRAQWQTIACVRRFPGATQRQIAELLEVAEVTAGRSIDKLAEAGWIERRADPADRRAYRIHLTGAIDPVLDELTRIGAAEEAAALTGFTAAERATLIAMLDRITTNLGSEAAPEDCDA